MTNNIDVPQHFMKKCKICFSIIDQCRCSTPGKRVIWGICSKCVTDQMTKASESQLSPIVGEEEVLYQVLSDIKARSDKGLEKYGSRLRTHNGRDALLDAYQEAIDLVMYLCQAIMERG